MASRSIWLVTWWDKQHHQVEGYTTQQRSVAETDIGTFKGQFNPADTAPDINLFKLSLGQDGRLYVKKCVIGDESDTGVMHPIDQAPITNPTPVPASTT